MQLPKPMNPTLTNSELSILTPALRDVPPSLQKRLSKNYNPSSQAPHRNKSDKRQRILIERSRKCGDRVLHARKIKNQTLTKERLSNSQKIEMLNASLASAEEAREERLRGISSLNAEQVSRAKKVAKENKERVSLEISLKRKRIEDRLAEAANRRQMLLRNRSSFTFRRSLERISATNLNLKFLLQDRSAKIIQTAYRRYKDIKYLDAFNALAFNAHSIQSMSFAEIASKLRSHELIETTVKVMHILGLLSESSTDENSSTLTNAADDKSTARTLLSAYMTIAKAEEVNVSSNDELGRMLKRQAQAFIDKFERSLKDARRAQITLACRGDLIALWLEYLDCFQRWKDNDKSALVNIIVGQYVELENMWQAIKSQYDANSAAEFHAGIKSNQILLLSKLRKLAGDETRGLIARALRKARREQQAAQDTSQQPTNSLQKEDPVEGDKISSSKHASEEVLDPIEKDKEESADLMQATMANLASFSNWQIVHELALNPKFQLSEAEYTGHTLHNQKEKILNEIVTALKADDKSQWIIALAKHIKGQLLTQVNGHNGQKLIEDAINIESLEQQCELNSFNYNDFLRSVVDVMGKLCSPSRDEIVQSILTSHASSDNLRLQIEQIELLLKVLDLLSVDRINFMLRMLAKSISRQDIIDAERKYFDEANLSSEKTRDWLQTIYSNSNDNISGIDRTILKSAVGSISFLRDLSIDELPESFKLDRPRICDTRNKTQRLIQFAAFVLQFKNCAISFSSTRSISKRLEETLKTRLRVLVIENEIDPESLVLELMALLDQHCKTPENVRKQQNTFLNGVTQRILDGNDKLVMLLNRRLVKLFEKYLLDRKLDDAQLSSVALDCVKDDLLIVYKQVSDFASLNIDIYLPHYTKVVSELSSCK